MSTISFPDYLRRSVSRFRSAVVSSQPRGRFESLPRVSAVLALAASLVMGAWAAIAPAEDFAPLLGLAAATLVLGLVYLTPARRQSLPPAAFGIVLAALASVGVGINPHEWSLGFIVLLLASLPVSYFASGRAVTLQLIVASGAFLTAVFAGGETRWLLHWIVVTVALAFFSLSVLVPTRLVDALVEDLRARVRGQRIVAQLGQRALSETDIETFVKEAATAVAGALALDRVVIYQCVRGGDALAVRAIAGWESGGLVPGDVIVADSFSRYTLLEGEPVIVTDLARETRLAPPPLLLDLGIVSAADVAIPGPERPWGIIGARTTTRRDFSEADIDFIHVIANVIGSAIERIEHEQSLRSSRASAAELNERLAAVIDASPVAIIEVDLDHRVTLWNKVAEDIFGWSRSEVIGARIPAIRKDRVEEADALMDRAVAGEQILGLQTEGIRRDGSVFPYAVSLAPHRDGEGNVVGVISLGSDLTERRLAEEELSRSRELYRVVVENSHDMIAVLDPMGRFMFASRSYEEALGYDPEELVDVSPISLVHPSDVQRASDALRQAVTSQNAAVVELRMRHKRGSWVFVEGTTTAVLDENGKLQSILMSFRDISERRIAEEELREAEARYRLLVEQLPLITYINVPGESGRWVYLSPQLEEMLGYKPADWTSDFQSFLDAIHPDDRERVAAERAASGGKGRIGLEYRLIARDGRMVWVRDEAVVVRDLSGKPLYVQGYLLDISAEREAETDRRRLQTQLLHSQKMEAIGRLAGGIAHDFNNLLTAITGYSELIVSELDPVSSMARDAEEIKRAAEQAAAMTQQLLAFSRRQVLQPSLLNPNEVIEHMEKMLRRLIGENIELVTEFDPEIASIRSDRSQIEQVILNLVVNARDAISNGGRITIATANVSLDPGAAARVGLPAGDYVTATISDTGHGMDEETISHIFEPFFTTKEQGEGTGLGLATVHGIVEQSSGAIEVSSEADAGSVFRVYLPVADKSVGTESVPVSLGETRGSETLLLVEDEEMVRQLVGRVLRGLGYDVIESSSGEEALALSGSLDKSIALIVTDVVMPGMSGRELAETLTVSRPNTKVLFMSGYTDESIVRDGVSGGEADFIGKPFTPQELAHKVRSVLDRSTNGDGSPQPAEE
jgi:two-component system cell cycle sensor histidine kinase/response regulator CckA